MKKSLKRGLFDVINWYIGCMEGGREDCGGASLGGLLSTGLLRLVSRPRQSQGVLYKHLHYSLTAPFPPTALWRCHAQTVRDSSLSYKIDYFIAMENFLNPQGHQDRISGSIVTAILLKGRILPFGGVASGRVCDCSLRSRLYL